MKAAVYAGTRNVYQNMITAAKSLLISNKMDKVYFLIEDDTFPYDLPPQIECINISDQKWFTPNCPNWHKRWGGAMTLIRAAYSQLFPHLDKILSLDNDTIVVDDISELWDLDLTGYYLAGARDMEQLCGNQLYINCGVVLYNLSKIREDKIDERVIALLNLRRWRYSEQEVFNRVCREYILELPSAYNNASCFMNYSPVNPKIIHYVGQPQYVNYSLVKAFEDMTWEDIKK